MKEDGETSKANVHTSTRKPKQENLIPSIIVIGNEGISRANILRESLGRNPPNDAT